MIGRTSTGQEADMRCHYAADGIVSLSSWYVKDSCTRCIADSVQPGVSTQLGEAGESGTVWTRVLLVGHACDVHSNESGTFWREPSRPMPATGQAGELERSSGCRIGRALEGNQVHAIFWTGRSQQGSRRVAPVLSRVARAGRFCFFITSKRLLGLLVAVMTARKPQREHL